MSRALHVLVLFSRPVDYPPYDAQALWSELSSVLDPLAQSGCLTYQHAIPANEATLRTSLTGCDVLHVVAHCRDARPGRLGSLVLEGHEARGRAVTPLFLAKLLRELAPSCAVVLQGPPGFEAVHDMMPQALLQGGVPAALSIGPGSAVGFRFYAALASGASVAAAARLSAGRVRVLAGDLHPLPASEAA